MQRSIRGLAALALFVACADGADEASGYANGAAEDAGPGMDATADSGVIQGGEGAPDAATDASSASDAPDGAAADPYAWFYGVNAHYEQGTASSAIDPNVQVGYLHDLGATMMRQDVGSADVATELASWSAPIRSGGVLILPVILPDFTGTESEQVAYDKSRALGLGIARNWASTGQHFYECGNELENRFTGGAGSDPSNYDESFYLAFRGTVRGLIDGVRAGDPQAQVAPAVGGWLHYGLYDMLMKGTEPNGTKGAPPVTWDFTGWHWYSDMGDIEDASDSHVNVLAKLATYGKPIWITEFGFRPDGDQNHQAAYITGDQALGKFYSKRATYDIRNATIYELFDFPSGDTDYGLFLVDGVTKKAAYGAVKSFIAAHR